MNSPSPARWTDQLWRAVLTVLATAVGVYIAWKLLSLTLPFLLVIAGLLFVIRIAVVGFQRRNGW